MEDLISVIVPVFNVERELLEKCIKSIINQTYKNLEIIMIDDGSVLECAKECDRLATTDSRIILIHQENKGLSGARNTGLDIAKGDYIGFVDSDDYIDKDMYRKLVESIVEKKVDISATGCITAYPNGKEKYRTYYEKDMVFSRDMALEELLTDKCFVSSMCEKLFKSELFNRNRFPEGKLYEDCYIMNHLVYQAINGVFFIKERLYYYYQRDNSIMNHRNLCKVNKEIDAWEYRLNFVEEHMPELSVKAKEKIVKLAIKGLLNPDFHKGLSKDEYVKNSEKIVKILLDGDTKDVIEEMPKYADDYRFLLKYKYNAFAKKVYLLKKRISGR